MKRLGIFSLLVLAFLSACRKGIEIPTEFPTPPPPASATPLPKLELHTDAELEKKFAEIAEAARGKVGAAAVVLETGDAAFLNGDQQFPMQSVYKLPISMAMLDQVRLDRHALDEVIGVSKDDMVRQGQHSPLRDGHPDGGEFTIRELIRLAMMESDGTASDVLLRVAGIEDVQAYLGGIGVRDLKVVNSEKEIGRDWQTQYQNWAKPAAAVELLRILCSSAGPPAGSPCPARGLPTDGAESFIDEMRAFMFNMDQSTPGANRIRGLLPKGTYVPHKTGTGGTQNGITSATNDIGIIYLPNGKHLAVAVFVSDSPADEKTREAVIARIAKAAWDKFGS